MRLRALLRNPNFRLLLLMLAAISLLLVMPDAFAEDAGDAQVGFGKVAANVLKVMGILTNAIAAAAYVAGVGFAVGAVMKFKQHKDNPTQIPIGTPIALLFIAVALIFLPTLISLTSETLFGEGEGKAGGPKGGGIDILYKEGGGTSGDTAAQ